METQPIPQTFARADVPRGCGKARDAGGVYAEVGFSPWGNPLEYFLFDPIVKFDKEKWGLNPRQPLVTEIDGRSVIFDWVGKSFYPNPTDILEEIRRYGLSRKLELSEAEYARLKEDTRIILVVPDAYIEPTLLAEVAELLPLSEVGYNWDYCPKEELHGDRHNLGMMKLKCCAGWSWQRVDTGTEEHPSKPGYVGRKMPAFTYLGAASPDAFLDADPAMFAPGMVASFRIGRLAVVEDKVANTHEKKLGKLKNCQLRVDVTEM